MTALNKVDALNRELQSKHIAALEAEAGKPVFAMSGVSGQGVQEVLRAVFAEIRKPGSVSGGDRTGGEPWYP